MASVACPAGGLDFGPARPDHMPRGPRHPVFFFNELSASAAPRHYGGNLIAAGSADHHPRPTDYFCAAEGGTRSPAWGIAPRGSLRWLGPAKPTKRRRKRLLSPPTAGPGTWPRGPTTAGPQSSAFWRLGVAGAGWRCSPQREPCPSLQAEGSADRPTAVPRPAPQSASPEGLTPEPALLRGRCSEGKRSTSPRAVTRHRAWTGSRCSEL